MESETTHADDSAADQRTEHRQTAWQVSYDDVTLIRIRDPVAEALCVLDPGEPFVIGYEDAVMAAGHSCPTAAGAYRITQLGLEALYPDATDTGDGDPQALPVRGDIEVLAGGPKSDSTYGVMSRIVSYVTGAAEEDGFAGLAGGHGNRKDHLHFGDLDTVDPTFRFHRRDTGDTVEVRYHVGDVPGAGPATQHLPKLIDGTATPEQREAFASAWHARVETVLTEDGLFTVRSVDWTP